MVISQDVLKKVFFSNEFYNLRRQIFVTFLLTFISYSFLTFHMLFGNHELHALNNSLLWLPTRVVNGSVVGHYINLLFSYGQILPVIPHLISFFIMVVLSNIFLAIYFKNFEDNGYDKIISTLLICFFTPFISLFYYSSVTIHFIFAIFFVVCGFYLITQNKLSTNIWGSVLVFFAIGSYEVSLSMVGVLSSLWLHNIAVKFDGSKEYIKHHFLKFTKMSFFLLLGIALFMITNKIVLLLKLAPSSLYRFSHYGLDELLQNFPKVFCEAFNHLIITQPFMGLDVKVLLLSILFLGITSSALIIFRCQNKLSYKLATFFCSLLFLVLAVAFCKTPQFLNKASAAQFYEYRFMVYGMPFIFSYCAYLTLKFFQNLKWIPLTVTTIVIILMLFNNLWAQKIWKFGYEREIALYTRVIERILTNENYKQSTKYTYMQMGTKNFRTADYKIKYDIPSREVLHFSLLAEWDSKALLKYIEPEINIVDSYNTRPWKGAPKGYGESLPIRKKYIDVLKSMEPWPSKKAVAIIDNYIFVAIDKDILRRYQDISQ